MPRDHQAASIAAVRRGGLLVLWVALLVGGGCGARSGPAAPAPAAPPSQLGAGRWDQTVQLLLRSARSQSGSLFQSAVEGAADEAARTVMGEEYPFDAWGRLAARPGELHVLAHPRGGPLAEAVAGRLELAAEGARSATVLESSEGGEIPSAAAVLVWRPRWVDGAVEPRLPDGTEAGLVLVDLLEPRVEGDVWRADAVIAAPAAAEARVVTRYVLAARASGSLPQARSLAAQEGLALEGRDWRRLSLAD
jgi:hypothetical protein